MQETGNRKQETARAPVRGTQTFVGVMVEVWKRPSLTAMEVAWRWLLGTALWLAWLAAPKSASGLWASFGGTPVSIHGLPILLPSKYALMVFLSLTLLLSIVWGAACGVGRGIVMRRFNERLTSVSSVVIFLCILRAVALTLVIALWALGCGEAFNTMIATSLRVGTTDPNLIGFSAIIITLTLLLFAAWASVSWVLQLAPVLAMAGGLGILESLRAAVGAKGEVRSKLIETNLVMGIVKVALLVLAMVLSASPLPFSNVETQTFLACWWGGVAVWWVVMSDYFHVVRAVAYLRLWQAYQDCV